MRVLVLGNRSFVRCFSAAPEDGLEMTGLPDNDEITAAIDGEQYDIVLVDGRDANAGDVCELIKGMCQVPVALMVSTGKMNWSQIDCFVIDGFVPASARGEELRARLKAILRRQGNGRSPVPEIEQ